MFVQTPLSLPRPPSIIAHTPLFLCPYSPLSLSITPSTFVHSTPLVFAQTLLRVYFCTDPLLLLQNPLFVCPDPPPTLPRPPSVCAQNPPPDSPSVASHSSLNAAVTRLLRHHPATTPESTSLTSNLPARRKPYPKPRPLAGSRRREVIVGFNDLRCECLLPSTGAQIERNQPEYTASNFGNVYTFSDSIRSRAFASPTSPIS